MDLKTPPPVFKSHWTWGWRGLPGDWGYPMSLDGHIFRTLAIRRRLVSRRYDNPNTLEAQLALKPLRHRTMRCYEHSRVMNLPMNRVQRVFNNRSGEIDPAGLNRAFLKGARIRLEPFDRFVNDSCHQELPLELTQGG